MSSTDDIDHDLTEQTRQHLREELAVLREQRDELGVLSDEVAGDGADAAEQLVRAEEAARLDARMTELNRLLAGGSAALITDLDTPNGLPDGSAVTLRFSDGATTTLRAAAVPEAIPDAERDDSLSLDSPLGRALAGASAGDTVRYDTPGGERQAKVVKIEPPA
ncbi:MAG TPA: GreA/GreB family elongation factor [Pseudonocardia sp.]|jgi:transcription elongation GreA/GreB family factor|nr:GreA/GreB family elongation factor [Pseudonocardia sp.]